MVNGDVNSSATTAIGDWGLVVTLEAFFGQFRTSVN